MFKLFKKKETPVNPEEEKRKDELYEMIRHAESREAAICVINNLLNVEQASVLFWTKEESINFEIEHIKNNGYTDIEEESKDWYIFRRKMNIDAIDADLERRGMGNLAMQEYAETFVKRIELAYDEFKKGNVTLGELSKKYFLPVGCLYEKFCDMMDNP